MSKLDDGYKTIISFSESASVKVYEKEVTPPGVSGGGEIDTTTMRNTGWRTKAPKALKSLTDSSLTVAYDPAVYDEMVGMIGTNQTITITFPDTSKVAFFGWVDEFTPGSNKEGEQPTASLTVKPSNTDPADGSEAGPTYTAPV